MTGARLGVEPGFLCLSLEPVPRQKRSPPLGYRARAESPDAVTSGFVRVRKVVDPEENLGRRGLRSQHDAFAGFALGRLGSG